MSDNNQMSSSEVAYRAVLAVQEAKKRQENAWSGPDTSNTMMTPFNVWGAFLGMVIGSFQTSSSPITWLAPFLGMAIGFGLFWAFGKVMHLVCATLGFLFRLVFSRNS